MKILLCIILAIVTAQLHAQEDHTAKPPYAPLLEGTFGKSHQSVGLVDDFLRARAARTWEEAVKRWAEFLKQHDPKSGEFEDGMHARLVWSARAEQMRALYTLGRIEEGDAIAHKLVHVLTQ